MSRKSLF